MDNNVASQFKLTLPCGERQETLFSITQEEYDLNSRSPVGSDNIVVIRPAKNVDLNSRSPVGSDTDRLYGYI